MKYQSRAYFVVNQYISGLQVGIQAAHCAIELVHNHQSRRRRPRWTNAAAITRARAIVKNWVEKDKVMIVLGGGGHADLLKWYEAFKKVGNPCAIFHEGKDDLNGAATCIGIIMTASQVRHMSECEELNEESVLGYLRNLKLAR